MEQTGITQLGLNYITFPGKTNLGTYTLYRSKKWTYRYTVKTMEITKENVSALDLHLVPRAGDSVLAYSDGIADTEYEHVDPSKEKDDMQSNKELKETVISEIEWYEEAE